ncbi:MAG: hypothetical protein H7276_03800 [Caulobacter sp.]|nr:hypothetical protein [Vitreoscilla sp.]
MTLHFHWLHAPRWLARAHFNRAMTLMLGVIAASLLFGVLRIMDVAISGRLVDRRAAAATPAASVPTELLVTDPAAAGPRPVQTEHVPDAAVEAISL